MSITGSRAGDSLMTRIGWWILVVIVVVYGSFSLQMGTSELLYLLGLAPEIKHRATPVVFILHALAGTVCLFIAPLQSVRWIRRRPGLRPALGRTYVIAVWIASVMAILDASSFHVTAASKAIFIVTAVLWFATTTVAAHRAWTRRFAELHEWMVRSYSLTLFVVSFSVLVPGLVHTSLPPNVSWPLGLFLSTTLNLAAAEIWIRRNRAQGHRRIPAPVVAVA